MRRLLQDEQGFSLVETLIATVIFALVSTAGVMLLSGYQDGRLSMQAADERLAQLEIARSLIRSDLITVVDRPVRDELGGSKSGFEGGSYLPDGALLRFVRGGDIGALVGGNKSALKRIEYLLVDDALVRRSYAQTDITSDTNYTDLPLLSDLQALEVRFEVDGIWVDEWGNGSAIVPAPGLAEFRARMANGRTLTMTFLIGGAA